MYGQFDINSGTLNVKNFILQNSEFSLLHDGKFSGIFFVGELDPKIDLR